MAGETTSHFTSTLIADSASYGALVTCYNKFEVLTTEQETDDLIKVGVLPPNALLHAVAFFTDDLDTDGSVALVWAILVGDTTYKAGIANDTAKAGTIAVGEPIKTTAMTSVYIKATTASATANEGTAAVTLFYTTTD